MNREFKLKYLKKLFDAHNILCLQEVHGKDEYLQAIQALAPRFRVFDTFFLDKENAGGSATCIHRDLLLEEAIVTHLVACHVRNHLVRIQTGRHNFVIVNVHFEPELTLRQLRGRLRLIHPHWLAYPNEVGVILGDFNICDPEGGRFNVSNQTFTDGHPVKTAVFHSFFPHVLEINQPDYTRSDFTVLGIIRTLWIIDRIFINLPMAEALDFHCSSHSCLRKCWEIVPFRVITQRYASSFKSQQIEDNRASVFTAGCPNILFSVPFSERPRSRRLVNSHGKHLTASGRRS